MGAYDPIRGHPIIYPVFKSQSLIEWSLHPVANIVPYELKATTITEARWGNYWTYS